jgi:hypothetical protein
MNNIPNKLILTCNITGKQVTWTNKAIIADKIAKHGSLEAFLSSYVSKGAGKVSTNMDKKKSETKEQAAASFNTKAKIVKPILEQGIKLGKMTEADYKRFNTRVQKLSDGSECTITTHAHEQVGNAS